VGLFGGGNSKRTTNNADNRIINDGEFAGNNGTVNDGQFAGNTGTITTTDGGAIDAALQLSEQGYHQTALGVDLAKSLAKDNNATLANSFKTSMQFVEDFSRSDGADLAAENSKTVGILVGGVVLVIAIYVFKKG